MLVLLTRAKKRCAACLLAAVYLLCVLAPAVSFGFGDGSRAAHCLTDEHHGLQANHVHVTPAHTHAAHTDKAADSKYDHGKTSSDGQCCGWSCFSALAASGFEMALPSLPRGPVGLAKMDAFAAHLPPGLFRPPLSPLPV